MFRAGTTLRDNRCGRSSLGLTPEWKNEVQRSVRDHPADSLSVQRWSNAGPKLQTKIFALFAITRVLVCLCRHGHLLVLFDIVRSGELYVDVIAPPCIGSFDRFFPE